MGLLLLILSGCTDGNEHTPKYRKIEVSITATDNATRTYLEPTEGGFEPRWGADDKLGVFGTRAEDSDFELGANVPFTIDPTSIGEEDYEASFDGTLTDVAAGEAISTKYYAYYPHNDKATTSEATAMTIPLPATQKPTQTSFDPIADLLVGYPVETTAPVGKLDNGGSELNFSFARIVAVASFGVSGIPTEVSAESMQSVTLTFGSPVAGEVIADLTSQTPAYYLDTESAQTSITLDYTDDDVLLDADFRMWWTMIPTETTLESITIETDNYTLSKDYTSTELNFRRAKVTTATIDLSTATITPKAVPFTPFTEDFESESFLNYSTFNEKSRSEGPTGREWIISFGTGSKTTPIRGKKSLQMRYLKSAPKNIPIAYTDFDLVGLRSVSFWATYGGGSYVAENLRLDYSTDGGETWVVGQNFTLTAVAVEYSYTLPASVLATDAVRIRFTTTDKAPTAANFRLYFIDDVSFSD
jgi:hypothetical protein